MATNSLLCRHIFGLNTYLQDNLSFLDETNYTYVAGSRIVVYNSLDKRQRFVHDLEIVNAVTAFACCTGKKVSAFAEKGTDSNPSSKIHVYDTKVFKKKKTLESESFGHICSAIQVTDDEKCIIALSSGLNPPSQSEQFLSSSVGGKLTNQQPRQQQIQGQGHQVLSIWNWSKSKMGASINIPVQNTNSAFHKMILNKQTNKHVCLWNEQTIKFYLVNETDIKQIDEFNKFGNDTSSSMCWLKLKPSANPADDANTFMSIHGTQNGNILIFSNGKYSSHMVGSGGVSNSKNSKEKGLGAAVTALASYTGGIIAGTKTGVLYFYKTASTSTSGSKLNHSASSGSLSPYTLIGDINIDILCGEDSVNGGSSVGIVNIVVDPSERRGFACTTTGQSISFSLDNISLITSGVTSSASAMTSSKMSGSASNANVTNAQSTVSLSNAACGSTIDPPSLAKQINLSFLHSPAHAANKPIVALDICSRKPLLVTCSKDNSVKFWNYKKHTMLFSKEIVEEVFSIRLHPYGHQVAVGYLDKVRVYHILMNDIKLCLEVGVKACRECQFSRGGSRLAMANGSTVVVYDFYTGERIADLRGHNSKVRGLCWLDQYSNTQLVSCGQEGAVYRWDLRSGKRTHEFLVKGISFISIVVSNDNTILVLGGDGIVRELSLNDLTLINTFDTHTTDNRVTSLVLAKSKKLCLLAKATADHCNPLVTVAAGGSGANAVNAVTNNKQQPTNAFVSGARGNLVVFNYPLPRPTTAASVEGAEENEEETMITPAISPEFEEFTSNAGAITQMRLSSDDQFLVTGDDQGNVVLYEVHNQDTRHKTTASITSNSNTTSTNITEFLSVNYWTDDIIIPFSELEEQLGHVAELKNRLEELHLNQEYQLKLLDMAQWDKIKAQNAIQGVRLDESRARLMAIKQEMETVEKEAKEALIRRQEQHDVTIHEIENNYQRQLVALVDNVRNRTQQRDILLISLEEQRKKLVHDHEKKVNRMIHQYEKKLKDDTEVNKLLREQNQQLKRELNEKCEALENDVDDTVQGLKTQYEKKLDVLRENSLRHKGENGLMLKKQRHIRQEIEEAKLEVAALIDIEKSLHEQVQRVEKESLIQRKEIKSRDMIIEDREKKLYELKKKNHELEKFKFVLDFKIKDLKMQIEPREEEIEALKAKIKETDAELETWHTGNVKIDRNIGELRSKLDYLQALLNKKREIRHKQEHVSLERFRGDVELAVRHVLSIPDLQKAAIELVAKHGTHGEIKPLVDPDVETEYNRHRNFLKQSVKELKTEYEDTIMTRLEANKLNLKTNMSLLSEINQQKTINSQLKKTVQSMMGSIRRANQAHQKHKKLDLNRASKKTLQQSTIEIKKIEPDNSMLIKPLPDAFSFTTYYNADGTAAGLDPVTLIGRREKRITALKDTIDILRNELGNIANEEMNSKNNRNQNFDDNDNEEFPLKTEDSLHTEYSGFEMKEYDEVPLAYQMKEDVTGNIPTKKFNDSVLSLSDTLDHMDLSKQQATHLSLPISTQDGTLVQPPNSGSRPSSSRPVVVTSARTVISSKSGTNSARQSAKLTTINLLPNIA